MLECVMRMRMWMGRRDYHSRPGLLTIIEAFLPTERVVSQELHLGVVWLGAGEIADEGAGAVSSNSVLEMSCSPEGSSPPLTCNKGRRPLRVEKNRAIV